MPTDKPGIFKRLLAGYRRLNTTLDLKTYFPSYFNIRLIRAGFLVMCAIYLLALVLYGTGEYVYIECESAQPCFCEVEPCAGEVLQPGETRGTRPPYIVREFQQIVFSVVLLTFATNHYLYYKRRKRDKAFCEEVVKADQ
jgi:hypothetical protein